MTTTETIPTCGGCDRPIFATESTDGGLCIRCAFKTGETIYLPHQHTGESCKVIKVYPFGTCDIVASDGRCYRLTGLGWL